MGGATYFPQLLASNLLYDSDRSSIAGDNADVSNWNKADKIILAIQVGYNGKDTAASTYKLQYRDETDDPGGSFVDVGASGEVKYAASSAVLVDDNAVTSGEARCTDPGNQTWQDGRENVGDNLLPDAGSFDLGSDCYTEFQFALDLSGAQSGHQYTFQLYNNTQGAGLGACASQVSIASADINVTCGVDNLVLTESPAAITYDRNVLAGTDNLAVTTYPATITIAENVNVDAGVVNMVLTEYPATISIDVEVLAGTKALALTEQPATLTFDRDVQCNAAALTVTSYPATVDIGGNTEVLAGTAALTLTEYPANINAEVNIQALCPSLTLTELLASISYDMNILAQTDSLVLTEYHASVSTGGGQPQENTLIGGGLMDESGHLKGGR
jgi:hypothetical protein